MEKTVTTATLLEMKRRGEKITALTCYDYSTAKILNEAGVDVLLVGDSLGNVKLGYENTLAVTVDDMIYHAKAVKRGNSRAMLWVDMPFLSYETGAADAVRNAGRIMKETGAHAVKLEGGLEVADIVKSIVKAKIPVVGHIGLTPQAINQFGGFKVQGKTVVGARKLVADAKALEKSGSCALVIEGVPSSVAKKITASVKIPTIGIGAGLFCDGQVLVSDDMLGIFSEFTPRFVKHYAKLRPIILSAVKQYCKEVRLQGFPDKEHSY
jgi:3-methyl-2-oxobutanoate hydroxymethyltransferase